MDPCDLHAAESQRLQPDRPRLTDAEPVAWAANIPGKYGAAPTMLFGYTENLVRSIAAAGGDPVTPFPLYRQPTLTDAEREAAEYFAAFFASPREGDAKHAATLRGLLERTI